MEDDWPSPNQVKRAIAIGLPLIRKLDSQAAALFAAAGVAMPPDFSVDPYDDSSDDSSDGGNAVNGQPAREPGQMTRMEPTSGLPSYSLGRAGEAAVLDAVRRVWPSAHDVSGRAHSGDIMIRTADGRICIEVKNYRSRVPSAQVDKFRADMAMTGAIAGLFVSIASPITGIETQPLVLQYERHGGGFVPCAYMTMPSPAEITAACSMLLQLVGAIAYADALIREREAAYTAMGELIDAVDGLSVVRSQYVGVVGGISAQLAGVAGDLRGVEAAIREKATMLTKALGGCDGDCDDNRIYADPKYCAYSDPVKKAIRDLINYVNSRTPADAGAWTSRGTAYLHRFTGVALRLYVREAKVALDCSSLGDNTILRMLRDRPRDVSVTDGAIIVAINGETLDSIMALI